MFIVCEPIAWGMEHVPFNAAFLRVIRLAYPRETIYFYAEESHVGHVKKQIGDEVGSTIQWKNIILPRRHSSFFSRIQSDFKLVRFLLDQLNGNNRNDVLVITGNPSVLWALKYNVCTVHKDKRIQVVIHGDFSKLRYRTSLKQHLNPFYHISTLKTALRVSARKHIQYIVLEEAVRDAVVEHLPFLHDSIRVIDHPIPVNEQTSVELNDFVYPIQFGFLGRVSNHKGFRDFIAIASDISKQFPGQASFHVIGRFGENFDCSTITGIESLSTKPTHDMLNRDEYIQKLNKLHYVCFFYNKYYELCASGALLDSVAWGKPIIATKLPVFKNLFSRYGDIGYLSKIEDSRKAIASILQELDVSRYNRQVQNMHAIRIARTPESLANRYRELFVNLYN